MCELAQAEKDLDVLNKVQRLIAPLDEDRQEAVLEAYSDVLEEQVMRYYPKEEIAQEGIGKLLKQGWDFIMGLIKKIYNFIAGFFGGSKGIPVTPKEVNKAVDKKDDEHVEEVKKVKKATNKAKSKTQSENRLKPFTLGSRDWAMQGMTGSAKETLHHIRFLVKKMEDTLGSLADQYNTNILLPLRKVSSLLDQKSTDIEHIAGSVNDVLERIETNTITIDVIMLPSHDLTVVNNQLTMNSVEGKTTEFNRDIKPEDESDYTSLVVSKNVFRDLLKTTGACIYEVNKILDRLKLMLEDYAKDPANKDTAPPPELSSALKHCASSLSKLKNNSQVIDRATGVINRLGPSMYRKGLKYQHNPTKN